MNSINDDIHSKIAKLCLEHFKSLPKSGKPKENEWTVLSCIVKEDSGEDFKVVALGTGTKCIGEDLMSEFGDILNDSHAEIICRRAFLRFIYEDMLIEHKITKFDPKRHCFSLYPTIRFHFFTTHIPCGDCAIFPKQHIEEFGDLIEEFYGISPPKKSKLDIYRTGAKCLANASEHDSHGEGAEYHITGVVRRKPGRGSPTLSVSCSDKIAKWGYLGVQGALLSTLLDSPIYMNSFTICGGTPFDNEAIKRGLYTRLNNIQLKDPYQKHEMIMKQVHLEFPFNKCQEKDPCPSSIIWLRSKETKRQLEVAVNGKKQGTTKKQNKKSGRLNICKKHLFYYFAQVIKQYDIALSDVSDLSKVTYHKAKSLAVGYQSSWIVLKEAFQTWSEKDKKFLEFTSEL